jgi:hypothetical protein
MVARLLALAIAVCTAATGVLPAGGGARCVAMNRVLRSDTDCCPKCVAAPVTSVGTPCCEAMPGATLGERAFNRIVEPQLAPAPLVAWLAPTPQTADVAVSARALVAVAPGRPPGDQLQRYSSVLRI